jgi:hypothetical protein
MSSHNYRLFPPTKWSEYLAAASKRWLEVIKDRREWWAEITHGRVKQADITVSTGDKTYDQLWKAIFEGAEMQMRYQMREEGIDDSKLFCVVCKILKTSKGSGQQQYHFDVVRLSKAVKSYAGIFYITRNKHTAVPRLTAEDMKTCYRDDDEAAEKDVAWQTLIKKIIVDENFVSEEVEPGASLLFRLDVLHRGVKNEYEEDRVVLFLQFSESSEPYQDMDQRFPLGFIEGQ